MNGDYDVSFLSQRDLALTVPINFVTNLGVSLTSSCFPQKIYDSDEFGICLGNLLDLGFRRFELDIYWDERRNIFSFCPVSIPDLILNPQPTPTANLSSSEKSLPTFHSFSASDSSSSSSQQTKNSINTAARTDLSSTISIANSLSNFTAKIKRSDDTLISIGSYTCSTVSNLLSLTTWLLQYIKRTDSTLEAHLVYLLINLHSASSKNLTEPNILSSATPSVLPTPNNLLGHTFSSDLKDYIYTPGNLKSDRANLNESWYKVTKRYQISRDYYTQSINKYGIATSNDGWPAESYIEFAQSKRLLLGWGAIDPQMSLYNFSGDSDTIFSPGSLKNNQSENNLTGSRELIKECLIENHAQGISFENSSSALETTLSSSGYLDSASNDLSSVLNLASNVSTCGISPFLNITLLNTSAVDPRPYRSYAHSTIWSWAQGEPRNYTKVNEDNTTIPEYLHRCATTHLSLSGHWSVSDCSLKNYGACRALGQPYNWTITSHAVTFSIVNNICPYGYEFAAPRTALENAFLTREMRRTDRNWDGEVKCWIAFNSLSMEGCWVIGGKNETCPYIDDTQAMDKIRRRTILIPTIAAILVLTLTAITILAKAARNRREGRRQRRHVMPAYEGVPG